MAFRFRLEKVLVYRKRLADLQAQRVAAASRGVREIEGRIACVCEEIDQTASAAGAPGAFSAASRTRLCAWLDHLNERRVGLEDRCAVARQELEQERRQLTSAWKDLEVLRKLKQKRKTEWTDRQRRRETRELDELGVQRADRQRREKLASASAHVARGTAYKDGAR